MRKSTAARWVLGATLAVFPLLSYPLGLGKLKVHSALNEPLNADVEFTSVAESELRGLAVNLAPRSDFDAAGAERMPFHSQIKFNVVRRPDGRHFLELRTDQPIEEPFLHLLVQFEWTGGRLVREYTALIDPPQFLASDRPSIEVPQTAPQAPAPVVETVPPPVAAAPAPAPAETVAPPATPATAPEVETVPPPVPAAEQTSDVAMADRIFEPAGAGDVPLAADGWPEDEAVPTVEALAAEPRDAAEPVSGLAGEYAVKRGDNLWSIAEKMRPDTGVTLEQVMVAIFKNNKSAFYENNLNNLRAGKILKLPEREQIESTGAAQARSEFRAHYDVWQEYKLKLAAGSRTLKVAEAGASETPVAAPEKADAQPSAPETPVPAQAKQSEEMLKIVRSAAESKTGTPDAGAAQSESALETAKREQAALAERAATLDESLESKQMENRELSEKVGQVRAQLKNEKRLLELESQSLAEAQAKAATPSAQAPGGAQPTETAPAPAAPVAAPEAKQEAAPAAATKPAVPKKPVTPPAPVEEKGFLASLLDDVLDDTMLPIVGGVVAIFGGLILIVYLRRRKRSIAEFEESILASDAIAPDSATTPSGTTGAAVTTGDTSFLSDFSQGGMGHVQTDEVDPIAEAEVYLAYGRDETAEEILREASVKHPERQEIKLKLLEIYHQRSDVAAFETMAEEMYAALGGRGGKVWERVEEMGRRLNPDNPMFGGSGANRRASDTAPVASPAVAPAGTGFAGMAGAAAATQIVEPSSETVDFDFDAGQAEDTPSPSEPRFDADVGDAPAGGSDLSFEEFRRAAISESGTIDFDASGLGHRDDNSIDFQAAVPMAEAAADLGLAEVSGGADDEIKWELDAPAGEPAVETAAETGDAAQPAANGEPQWDETATKLDLARAYMDMGDAEGARSILEEVMAEGSDQQKRQAADLATQLG